ncbi:MAG: hypothetical protein AAB625_00325 [Patescibacteria group bacterium]
MKDDRLIGQPNKDDPREKAIREKLDLINNTEWSKSFFEIVKNKQVEFFRNSINKTPSTLSVRNLYLDLVEEISSKGKTEIKSGIDNLLEIHSGPLIVITNHLGTAKISRIKTNIININNYPLEEIEPFPVRVAPISLIAQKLSLNLHECAIELPQPFLNIQNQSGVITIPARGEGKTKLLQSKINSLISTEPNSLIIMYPEGGTSGKRNDGNPYDLDIFHTGSFVIAKNLNLPILPIFQSFDSNHGSRLDILKQIMPNELNSLNIKMVSEDTRSKMQSFSRKLT